MYYLHTYLYIGTAIVLQQIKFLCVAAYSIWDASNSFCKVMGYKMGFSSGTSGKDLTPNPGDMRDAGSVLGWEHP